MGRLQKAVYCSASCRLLETKRLPLASSYIMIKMIGAFIKQLCVLFLMSQCHATGYSVNNQFVILCH